ncbi:MAG: hypothetical protein ACKO7B_15805, partial [Flavobacteriales bacterium]
SFIDLSRKALVTLVMVPQLSVGTLNCAPCSWINCSTLPLSSYLTCSLLAYRATSSINALPSARMNSDVWDFFTSPFGALEEL